jgi:aldoxime dehydratase
MESAIAKHLVCPRTIARSMEDGYTPPYPAWTARTDASVTQVVMAYLGVQFYRQDLHGKACMALEHILRSLKKTCGPGHYDIARFKDAQGFENMVIIAYWKDPGQFDEWRLSPDVDNWWNAEERLTDGIGYFREILKPHIEHFETAFSSSDVLEGVGVVMGQLSDEIQEHAYWGGMRDRIPLAQTDSLAPLGSLETKVEVLPSGKRIQIIGHENIAVIRSGQDWVDTENKERDLYINNMEPILNRGMDFLQAQGLGIGCYTNRYMQNIDEKGKKIEKSFGLSYWRSLSDLEAWAKSHPTHLAIFSTFMNIVQELEFNLKLRSWHEVAVLKTDEQEYQYVNCHPKTGLLNGLNF